MGFVVYIYICIIVYSPYMKCFRTRFQQKSGEYQSMILKQTPYKHCLNGVVYVYYMYIYIYTYQYVNPDMLSKW